MQKLNNYNITDTKCHELCNKKKAYIKTTQFLDNSLPF